MTKTITTTPAADSSWERLRDELLGSRKVIIYGAGKIGQRVHKALARLGIRPEFFWDVNAHLIERVDDTAVVQPDLEGIAPERRPELAIIMTIFSETVGNMVSDSLRNAGYCHVIEDREFINRLLYEECRKSGAVEPHNCSFCPKITTKNSCCDLFFGEVTRGMQLPDPAGLFAIPSMGVITTTRCTLTCAGCNHLRDHFQPEHNVSIPARQIIADLTTVLDHVDVINKLVLVGGELFLHPELAQLLKAVLELPRVGIIHIISNGTVVPKGEEVFALLADRRVIMEISGYGARLPEGMRERVAVFMEALSQRRIPYRHTQTMQWFDFGGFESRSLSGSELEKVYSTCCFVSNDLFNGRIHSCSRSALGTFLGKLPDYPEDYVELRSGTDADLRERLERFFNKSFARACDHCAGTSTSTIEAGRQTGVPKATSKP